MTSTTKTAAAKKAEALATELRSLRTSATLMDSQGNAVTSEFGTTVASESQYETFRSAVHAAMDEHLSDFRQALRTELKTDYGIEASDTSAESREDLKAANEMMGEFADKIAAQAFDTAPTRSTQEIDQLATDIALAVGSERLTRVSNDTTMYFGALHAAVEQGNTEAVKAAAFGLSLTGKQLDSALLAQPEFKEVTDKLRQITAIDDKLLTVGVSSSAALERATALIDDRQSAGSGEISEVITQLRNAATFASTAKEKDVASLGKSLEGLADSLEQGKSKGALLQDLDAAQSQYDSVVLKSARDLVSRAQESAQGYDKSLEAVTHKVQEATERFGSYVVDKVAGERADDFGAILKLSVDAGAVEAALEKRDPKLAAEVADVMKNQLEAMREQEAREAQSPRQPGIDLQLIKDSFPDSAASEKQGDVRSEALKAAEAEKDAAPKREAQAEAQMEME